MKIVFLTLRFLIAAFQRVFYVLSAGELPPFVGVAVIIKRDGKFLMIDRNDGTGFGMPGGFIKLDETCEQAALREVAEETGMQIELIRLAGVLSGKRRGTLVRTVDVIFEGRTVAGVLHDSAEGRSVWVTIDEIRDRIAFDYFDILKRYL